MIFKNEILDRMFVGWVLCSAWGLAGLIFYTAFLCPQPDEWFTWLGYLAGIGMPAIAFAMTVAVGRYVLTGSQFKA
jgi:hypothetical protein